MKIPKYTFSILRPNFNFPQIQHTPRTRHLQYFTEKKHTHLEILCATIFRYLEPSRFFLSFRLYQVDKFLTAFVPNSHTIPKFHRRLRGGRIIGSLIKPCPRPRSRDRLANPIPPYPAHLRRPLWPPFHLSIRAPQPPV